MEGLALSSTTKSISMQTYQVKAVAKEATGKKANKDLRKSNLVPCCMYGGGKNVNFCISKLDVERILSSPLLYLVEIELDGTTLKGIVKDSQFHPVTGNPLHLDFIEVAEDRPVIAKLPIKLIGTAEGVKAGGKLTKGVRRLTVSGLVKDFPDYLEVNVEKLDLGMAIKAENVSFEGLQVLDAKFTAIVSIEMTRQARQAEQEDKKKK